MPAVSKTKGSEAPVEAGFGEVILDFSGVKPFEPLDPTRKYLCTVTKLDLSESKSNRPKSHCELTIEDPDEVAVEVWGENHKGDLVPQGVSRDKTTKAKGRILFREFSLEAKALPFLYEFIRAVNPEADLGTDTFKYNPVDYIGLQCVVSIVNEPYEGQAQSRVRRMYPVSAYKG